MHGRAGEAHLVALPDGGTTTVRSGELHFDAVAALIAKVIEQDAEIQLLRERQQRDAELIREVIPRLSEMLLAERQGDM